MIRVREENLEDCLKGLCLMCKKELKFQEEWWLDFLYLIGNCACGYENSVLLKKA
ncbi:hypothetical protein GOV11_03595 [Candidatus Woesearchaeota archaeon]|nr:hypothetical protein [Candidatus Woesearchaeota archaeon]